MSEMKEKYSDLTLPSSTLNGIYRGVVENNVDPEKRGRCKIRVYGVHTENKKQTLSDGIPTDHLPWAEPCTPISGGSSKAGMYGTPRQGAHVFLFFENGHILQPRFFATAPGNETPFTHPDYGFSDPDGENPKKSEVGDWHTGVGEEDGTGSEAQNCVTIADSSGNKLILDATEDKEKVILTHGKSGAGIQIDENGFKIISGTHSQNEYTGEKNTNIDGNHNLIVAENYMVHSGTYSEDIIGEKTSMSSTSDEVTLGIMNKKSKGYSQDVEGDSKISIGGESSLTSGKENLIKSREDNVKIEATLLNIKMLAELGVIESSSMRIDMSATTTAKFKGLIITTLGDGAITEVKGQIIKIG